MSANFIQFCGVRDELSKENLQYLPALKTGIEALARCYDIYTGRDYGEKTGWRKELIEADVSVYSTKIDQGRLFSVQYEVPATFEECVDDDWHGVERIPDWNQDVDLACRLVKLTDNVDIVHYANKPILMVSGRDYVLVRARREVDGVVYTSGYSLEEDPPNVLGLKGRIRGFIHVNGGRFRRHPTKPGVTLVDSIICIDVKGMVPVRLINAQMPRQLLKEAHKSQNRALCKHNQRKRAD